MADDFVFKHDDLTRFIASFQAIINEADQFHRDLLTKLGWRTMSQIKGETPVDTGNLRNRWELTAVYKIGDEFFIDINNSSEYASFVEDGHSTTGQGVARRWVPGNWIGDKFVYDPNSKDGMMLTKKWIDGKHMAAISLKRLENRIQHEYDVALTKWLKEHKVF